MSLLKTALYPTTLKMRLLLIALLGVGIVIGGGGIAYAQSEIQDNRDLYNTILIFAAALVFLMQAGFAFLGAGLIRAKNTVNYMTKSFLDFCIASLGFWAFGYALMWGGGAIPQLIGLDGFFLIGFDDAALADWFFQMVFAGTAATIIAGAMAERTKINAYFAYSFIVGALIYPIYGHWVWGGGWLAMMGMADYAGSGVVHMIGGFLALAGAMVVGPRKGWEQGIVIRGHNVPYVVIGTFILFFGWFGFNIGVFTDSIGLNAVNTLLAGAAGATSAIYLTLLRTGKADLEMAANGALAGLVGITAGCAYVDVWAAVVIGLIAGVILPFGLSFVKDVLKVDDPVGAVTVHGICGAWGVLAVGIFPSGLHGEVTGLVGGNPAQLVPQIAGIITAIVWGFGGGFVLFKVLDLTMGLRVSEEEEEIGLDETEHGTVAYPQMN